MRRKIPVTPRKANIYFVQHPLHGHHTPGRYSYKASGYALNLDACTRGPWNGSLYADGLAPDTPGPNVDPNVFSEVLPWHLSFCQISDTEPSSMVAGASRPGVLSEFVKAGDILIFGNTFNMNVTWIDTIICVHGRATIPTEGGQFVLEDQFEQYWQDVSEFSPGMTWERFKGFRDYRRNLIDSIPPNGRHSTTKVIPHYQIIGRRMKDTPVGRSAILTQFLAGEGFNFIPLRASDAPILTDNQQEAKRPGLLAFNFSLRRQMDDVENSVHLLTEDLGKQLFDAILKAAKYLVLDPVGPLSPKAL